MKPLAPNQIDSPKVPDLSYTKYTVERRGYVRRLDFDEIQFEQLVNAGIAAVKGGDRDQARTLLVKATEMKPSDTRPWLWLSATTDDLVEQHDYLENALAADPNNAAARRGLVLLSEKLDRSRLLKEGQGVEPTHAQEPEEAHAAQIFACPQCGGRMGFDPEKQGLACESCGYIEEIGVDVPESSEAAEQVLDFVMPTTLAHRWAEAQSRFSCAQCGAVTLLRPGQIASLCPYCGSSQMIESSEFSELVDPHSIAPAQFTGEEAANHVRQWLGRGWFIPDDLKNLAQTSQLRPAYYPFWTFDGTLQMKWSCEVNEGSSNSPNWVMRTGEEYKMFDDVLVLGVRKISDEELSRIEPFQLKELVAFDPKYLAGWVALTYELALADASLEAREKVARELRQDLHNRVLLGQEKRNLEGGGVAWSGMTFKLALLPLWIGSYHYRGKNYRLLVNGQTGKVGGEKPTDSIKVAASIMMVLLALGVLGLLVWGLGLTFGWFSF